MPYSESEVEVMGSEVEVMGGEVEVCVVIQCGRCKLI